MNTTETEFAPQYERTRRLIGDEALLKLQHSFVCIVGMGAVGGHALEGITRAGVGSIRIIDFDKFEESNINRQLLATHATVGHPKVEVAKERILSINPDCQIDAHDIFFEPGKEEVVFAPFNGKSQPDLVIDCIDSVPSKAHLLSECLKRQIPVFSSMGAARHLDSFAIQTADISKTSCCPLAKQVRLLLRKAGFNKGVTTVFSTEIPPKHEVGSPLGSLPTITALFGIQLAHLAIKKLISEE